MNQLVATTLDGVREALAANFVGMYLHGSLATGNFVPGRSDVDFLVVTERTPTAAEAARLAAMHEAIAALRPTTAPAVEGSYLPRGWLRRHDPDDSEHLAWRVEGDLLRWPHGWDWVMQRHIIRRHAIVVAGPAAHELTEPVTPEELRKANRAGTLSWWPQALEDPGLPPGPEYLVFAVLTMARVLYTDHTSRVAGKDAAADWMAQRFPTWAELLRTAQRWRQGDDFERRSETMALITFVLGQVGASPEG